MWHLVVVILDCCVQGRFAIEYLIAIKWMLRYPACFGADVADGLFSYEVGFRFEFQTSAATR